MKPIYSTCITVILCMQAPCINYQRVESRGVHVVAVALSAAGGVGAPVHPESGRRAQLVSGGGQQAALVHGTVHRRLRGGGGGGGCSHAGGGGGGVRDGSAGGFAASCERVGCHQELIKYTKTNKNKGDRMKRVQLF